LKQGKKTNNFVISSTADIYEKQHFDSRMVATIRKKTCNGIIHYLYHYSLTFIMPQYEFIKTVIALAITGTIQIIKRSTIVSQRRRAL
jgi:hypothetical protein